MFNLSRYFSTVSFILVVLAAGVLGPLYQKLSLQQMQALAESRNVAMAQVFQNALQSALASVISDSVETPGAVGMRNGDCEELGPVTVREPRASATSARICGLVTPLK